MGQIQAGRDQAESPVVLHEEADRQILEVLHRSWWPGLRLEVVLGGLLELGAVLVVQMEDGSGHILGHV